MVGAMWASRCAQPQDDASRRVASARIAQRRRCCRVARRARVRPSLREQLRGPGTATSPSHPLNRCIMLTLTPFLRSATARTRPPMPPPAMQTSSGRCSCCALTPLPVACGAPATAAAVTRGRRAPDASARGLRRLEMDGICCCCTGEQQSRETALLLLLLLLTAAAPASAAQACAEARCWRGFISPPRADALMLPAASIAACVIACK